MSAYVDGELSGEQMLSIREHLKSCPECEACEQIERRLKRLMGSLTACPPQEDFESRLVESVITKPRQRREKRRFGWTLVASGMAAAVATILFLRVQAWNSDQPDIQNNSSTTASVVSNDQATFSASDPIGGQAPLPVAYGNEETSR